MKPDTDASLLPDTRRRRGLVRCAAAATATLLAAAGLPACPVMWR